MKKNGTIAVALGLMLTLGASLAPATTTSAASAAPKTTPVPMTYPLAKTVQKLSIFARNNSAGVVGDYKAVKAFQEAEKKLGVDVTWRMPAIGSENDQFNIMIASNDYPDIIFWILDQTPMKLSGLLDEGIVINADKYIRQYAGDYLEQLKKDPDMAKQAVLADGTYPGMYKLEPVAERNAFKGLQVRNDMFKSLNLPVPETIDDWYSVLKAFKAKYPNVVPFGDQKGSLLQGFMGGFEVLNTFCRIPTTGQVVFGPLQPGYKDFVTTMSKWYSEGLIDKDFTTLDGKAFGAKMVNNQIASYYGNVGGGIGTYTAQARPNTPEFELKAVPYPKKDKAMKVPYTAHADMLARSGPDIAVVTKNAKDPKIAVQYMNFFYTPEGHNLINWGIENESYKVVNGKKTFMDNVMKSPEGMTPNQIAVKYAVVINGWFKAMDIDAFTQISFVLPEQKETPGIWGNVSTDLIMPVLMLNSKDNARVNEIMPDVKTYVDEMTLKFIIGAEPLSKYDQFVATLKKMNAEEAATLMDKAMKQYNSR